MHYKCPDPTPEQIALGRELGFDPYDRCGDGELDTPPTDILCAACLIHDEMTLRGGDELQWRKLAENFERDCFILARAEENSFKRLAAEVEAEIYVEIVWDFSWELWVEKDRSTAITRRQGDEQMDVAKLWINICAEKISVHTPYPAIP